MLFHIRIVDGQSVLTSLASVCNSNEIGYSRRRCAASSSGSRQSAYIMRSTMSLKPCISKSYNISGFLLISCNSLSYCPLRLASLLMILSIRLRFTSMAFRDCNIYSGFSECRFLTTIEFVIVSVRAITMGLLALSAAPDIGHTCGESSASHLFPQRINHIVIVDAEKEEPWFPTYNTSNSASAEETLIQMPIVVNHNGIMSASFKFHFK